MEFDLIVVGLGPGGEDVAGKLARAGRSVLGIDERLVGGECPYYGCIPSKMILRGADVLAEAPAHRRARRAALGSSPTSRRSPTASATRRPTTGTTRWPSSGSRRPGRPSCAARAGWPAATSAGRLLVEVGGETHAAPSVVRRHRHVAGDPADRRPRRAARASGPTGWSGRTARALQARRAPASLVVLGGGAIGCELAQGFARYGTRTTVVEAAPHLLMPEEPEAGAGPRRGVRSVRASPCARASASQRVDARRRRRAGHAGRRHDAAPARSCWSPPGGVPNLDIGLDTSASTRRARTLEVDEHMRVLDTARGRGAVRDRRHHRPRRVHPRRRVAVEGARRAPARRGRAVRRLSRPRLGDVHRPGGRVASG